MPDCQELLQSWLERAAEAFHSLDNNNHLLSIGSEGFWAFEDRVPVEWQK